MKGIGTNNSGSGGGNNKASIDDGCRGEFDPAVEAVKVAKDSAKLLVRSLNTLSPNDAHGHSHVSCSRAGGRNGGAGDSGDLMVVDGAEERSGVLLGPARVRARAAAELVSSTTFGEAVREARDVLFLG